MKYRVHISDKAEADVAGVLAWFQSQLAAKAGERWFAALWKSAHGIVDDNGAPSPATARRFPSGLQATVFIGNERSFNESIKLPVTGCHILTE